jgi:protein TonB
MNTSAGFQINILLTKKKVVMRPEQILQSDVLDIVFNNRNKLYGAYALRKSYNVQLVKALSATSLAVLVFALFSFIKPAADIDENAIPIIEVKPVDITPLKKEVPEKPKESLQKKYDKPIRQEIFTKPDITPDHNVIETIPEQRELDKSIIGLTKVEGEDAGPKEILPQGNQDNYGKEAAAIKEVVKEEPAITTPLLFADEMPEFPGGKDAFLKFMHRHLAQPDNLDEGQKVVVRVKFVVAADGSIKDVSVLQSGGILDAEVLRVVKKMPKWKPGKQRGSLVPVWFTLPVTFIGE